MHIRAGVGARLRDERERLDRNQDHFGAVAGVSRRTQAAYEADKNSPDVTYLSAIAEAGVDLHYVLTGRRDAQGLSAEESALVSLYQGLDRERQELVLALCRLLAAAPRRPAGDRPTLHDRTRPFRARK